MSLYPLEKLFPAELERRLQEAPILVLPFGTIEWHSHHLPLGLDGLVAHSVAEKIADRIQAVLAPTSYWAVGGVPFPYTLNLSIETVEPLLLALYEQFAAMGFQLIVAFTGHFGLEQTLAVKRAAVAVMRRSSATILPVTAYDTVTDLYKGDHAGIGETSLLWAVDAKLVRINSIAEGATLDGVIGADPRGGAANVKYGNELLAALSERTADLAHRLWQKTSPVARWQYLEALHAGVRVLERTVEQRGRLPKSEVPSLMTPAYLGYCQAIFEGDYARAREFAERKVTTLSA